MNKLLYNITKIAFDQQTPSASVKKQEQATTQTPGVSGKEWAAATAAHAVSPSILSIAAGVPAIKHLQSKTPISKTDSVLRNQLAKNMKRNGVEIKTPSGYKGKLPYAYQDPVNGRLYVSRGSFVSPYSLSHEYGHILGKSPKANNKMGMLRRNFRGLKSTIPWLAPVAASDETVAQGTAAAQALLMAPTVAEEIGASYRGSKKLNKIAIRNGLKLPIFGRLKPFMGVASYAADMLGPAITYGTMKLTGYYDRLNKWLEKPSDEGTREQEHLNK